MSDSLLRLEQFLPYRLNRLADAVSREFSAIYHEKYGLTRPEWRLLATLGQYRSMTATEIGRHSSMHKTKVSRAVSSLEKRRWLKRIPVRSDRRAEQLELSAAGQRAYGEMVPLARDFERGLWEGIGPARRAEFELALGRLEEAILAANRGSG